MKRKVSPELSRPQKNRRADGVEGKSFVRADQTIDEDGDLRLIVTQTGGRWHCRYLVDRRTLCRASPVFRAMLGKRGKFAEAQGQGDREGDGSVQEIDPEDDNPTAFWQILKTIHLQTEDICEDVSFSDLHGMAVLVDKYDLSKSMGYGPRIWSRRAFCNWLHPWLRPRKRYKEWDFMIATFGLKDLLHDLVGHLVFDGYEDSDIFLVAPRGDRLQGTFPQYIIGRLSVQCLILGAGLTIPDIVISIRTTLFDKSATAISQHMHDLEVTPDHCRLLRESNVDVEHVDMAKVEICCGMQLGRLRRAFSSAIGDEGGLNLTSMSYSEVEARIEAVKSTLDSEVFSPEFRNTHQGCFYIDDIFYIKDEAWLAQYYSIFL